MELQDLEFFQSELSKDSPDLTEEEVAEAIDTVSADDLALKVAEHLKSRLETGIVSEIKHERRLFGGVNYHVAIFDGQRKLFKIAWLPQ